MLSAPIVYLGLGSSLGDRRKSLEDALARLPDGEMLSVLRVSSFYESPHMAARPGDAERFPPHLNCVAEVVTWLAPMDLLQHIRLVEQAGGRQRETHWGPRTIDIDILLFAGQTIDTPDLKIPHPGLGSRAFVLRPLSELVPDLQLLDGHNIADMLNADAVRAQAIRLVPRAETQ